MRDGETHRAACVPMLKAQNDDIIKDGRQKDRTCAIHGDATQDEGVSIHRTQEDDVIGCGRSIKIID
ncbi:hypothetical protein FKM82_010670 [Ascaphus truei]